MRIGITFDLKTASPCDDDSQEEFDSPATIDAIAQAIRRLGHDVVLLGDGRDMLEALLADPPEFVFNFAEGHGVSRTREARVPAVLEMLGIPYSGSDPLTLAATLDKDCAERLVASAGIATPRARLVMSEERDWKMDFPADFPFPAIVKPNWEGSSKGIRHRCLVKSPDELAETVDWLRSEQRQPVLIEEYVDGEELTVGLLGNDLGATHGIPAAGLSVLGIMRVLPQFATEHFVYTLEVKRDFRRLVRYECPPQLPAKDVAAVERAARTVWRTLGCRDVSRIDFRLQHGVPYFLEVNPLPGLHPDDSDLVIMAKLVGWTYGRLVETILNAALVRTETLVSCDPSRMPSCLP